MAAGLLLGDVTAAPRAHLAVCRPRLHLCSWAPRPLRLHHGCRARARRVPARFAASASGGGGGEYKSEEEERREREAEMRRRLKEAEEMDELERTAEELQSRASAVDESEEEKRERVRRELQKVAKEQAERRATAKQMFDLGQRAYGKGMYGRSIEFLESALTIIRPSSLLGGEDDGAGHRSHRREAPTETAAAGSQSASSRRPPWAPDQTREKAHRGMDSASVDEEEGVNASTRTPLATTAGRGKGETRRQASTPPPLPPRPAEEGARAADLLPKHQLLGAL